MKLTFVICSFWWSFLTVNSAEWPQYRGPNSDGSTSEEIGATKWPATGPRQVWKAKTPDGFSSLAIGGGKAFTLIGRQSGGAYQEVCVALDVQSGQELWASPLQPVKFDGMGNDGEGNNKGGEGPRSTPAYSDGKVYVLSAKLLLVCLDAGTGKAVWKKDLMREHGGRNISWENAASPLIEGDMVFVAGGGPGQSLLGINKADGKVVWKSEDTKMTHASPIAATIHGQRQIIFFMQNGLIAAAPKSGVVLWRHPFRFNVSTAASPVVGEDIVYCAAGYGVGSSAAKITKSGNSFSAKEIWRQKGDKPVANHWSTPLYYEGHLYGMFSFKDYGKGPLKCVELATGKVKWEQPGFGAGNVIRAGRHLIALSDKGEVVLVEANANGYKELARADVLDGKCWSTPAISDGHIYARSTKEAVCLDITQRTAQK